MYDFFTQSPFSTNMPTSIWIEPISGACGALCATLILHPLDTLKVQLQGNNLNLKQTIAGVHKGNHWYAGVGANIMGNVVAWSSYFLLYSEFKQQIDSPFVAASAAGACTLLFTNPLFVAKTRMITEPRYYSSFVNCIASIVKKEGPLGLYAGFGMGLIGTLHGGVQFFAYERIKTFFNLDSSNFSTISYLLASGSSKVIATCATYPYQVIRTRLQQRNNDKTAIGITKNVYTEYGLLGFYRGLVPGLVRVLPASMITLTCYEATKRFLIDFK